MASTGITRGRDLLIWLAQIVFEVKPDPVKIVMGFKLKEYLQKMMNWELKGDLKACYTLG